MRLRLLDELRTDLAYAARTLRRTPGFTIVIVLTLALGLGGSTAVFSAVDATVLRPLPYPEPDRLVAVGTRETTAAVSRLSRVAPEDFLRWRQHAAPFERLAAYTPTTAMTLLEGDREPEELRTIAVSPEFFDALGVRPLLGRVPREDAAAAGERGALISYDLWQHRFGGTPDVIGRMISLRSGVSGRLNSVQGDFYRITGVMPRDFAFTVPSTPVALMGPIQVFAPLTMRPDESGRARSRYDAAWWTIGRLAVGVSREAALQRMNELALALAGSRADWKDRRVEVVPLADFQRGGSTRRWMLLLLGAVALTLLIVCANVAGLLAARASVRSREVGIRAALGASRWRLARQLFVESAVLSAAGLAAGLLLAWWGIGVLRAAMPDTVTGAAGMALDLRVLLVAAAATAACALMCGVLPALHGSRVRLANSIKGVAQSGSIGTGARRFRHALVVAELALAVVLLVGAGLFIGSFTKLMRVDVGYDPTHVLTAGVFPSGPGAAGHTASALTQIVDRLKTAPGVQYAAAISGAVLFARSPSTAVVAFAKPDGREVRTWISTVTADYHRALRIPLLSGRYLQESDHAGTVAVVNQSAARMLFGDENAIERTFKLFGERRVVGVVADTRVGLEGAAPAVIFLPLSERPAPFGYLVVRTAGSPTSLLPTVRTIVQSILPGQAIRDTRSLEDIHAQMAAQRRVSMELLTLFGMFGLVIAVLGLYGVMAYIASQQRREIGIRLALGATPLGIVTRFMRQGATLVALGLSIGMTGAWLLSGSAKPFLFEMEPTEPAVFITAIVVLAASGLAASVVPARRAAVVDPCETLRTE